MSVSQAGELLSIAHEFEKKAQMLRQMAAELSDASRPKSLAPVAGKRKMSEAAKAKISKKLRAAWKVRKQIKEAK